MSEEEDWLVRFYDHENKHGDAMDYCTFEEALVKFKMSIDEYPEHEWTLYHYYAYKPDGEGGWHEPIEDVLKYWDGKELFEYD